MFKVNHIKKNQERRSAFLNIRRALMQEKRFPENVFSGRLSPFLFFEADCVMSSEFQASGIHLQI
ncbi:hypothetical protein DXT91_27095 [Agrobacterium tumefaciens]|nr:hypothetical protein [Agrobacterium tumefaciens]